MTNHADGLTCFDPPYDARRVANEILRIASRHQRGVSNLSLQKILFFIHAHFISDFAAPLVNEEFEAWQYGPVSRTVYSSFRNYDSRIIDQKAKSIDHRTLRSVDIPPIADASVVEYLEIKFEFYGYLSPGALVTLSHEPGSPWDKVWQDSAIRSNLGMKIPNRLVAEYYRNFPSPRRNQLNGQKETERVAGYGPLPDRAGRH